MSPAEARASYDAVHSRLEQLRRAADELAALTDRLLSDATDLARHLEEIERALSERS